MNSKEIGNEIRQRRKYLEINQTTLSELSGIGINTLVAIERGIGNPKLETLIAVLNTLGLQINITLKD